MSGQYSIPRTFYFKIAIFVENWLAFLRNLQNMPWLYFDLSLLQFYA